MLVFYTKASLCLIEKEINSCFLFILLQDRFAGVDIRVRVNGGGHVSQIYAIRQAISKALVAYYQKCKNYFYQLCFFFDFFV